MLPSSLPGNMASEGWTSMFSVQKSLPHKMMRCPLWLYCSTCYTAHSWTLRHLYCVCVVCAARTCAVGTDLTPFRVLSQQREEFDMILGGNIVRSQCWRWASVSSEDWPDHLTHSKCISEWRKSLSKTTHLTCANIQLKVEGRQLRFPPLTNYKMQKQALGPGCVEGALFCRECLCMGCHCWVQGRWWGTGVWRGAGGQVGGLEVGDREVGSGNPLLQGHGSRRMWPQAQSLVGGWMAPQRGPSPASSYQSVPPPTPAFPLLHPRLVCGLEAQCRPNYEPVEKAKGLWGAGQTAVQWGIEVKGFWGTGSHRDMTKGTLTFNLFLQHCQVISYFGFQLIDFKNPAKKTLMY